MVGGVCEREKGRQGVCVLCVHACMLAASLLQHTCSTLIAILSHLGQSSFAKALTIAAGSFLLGKGVEAAAAASRACRLYGSSSGGF